MKLASRDASFEQIGKRTDVGLAKDIPHRPLWVMRTRASSGPISLVVVSCFMAPDLPPLKTVNLTIVADMKWIREILCNQGCGWVRLNMSGDYQVFIHLACLQGAAR
jgi:hypothetical protein